jgi:hypothetical protein
MPPRHKGTKAKRKIRISKSKMVDNNEWKKVAEEAKGYVRKA